MENYKYENAHPEKGIEKRFESGKKYAFTLSCKTFRSRLLNALLRSRIARRSQTKYRIPLANDTQSFARQSAAHSYGFTLAETLIVLVILGITVAIVVPALVRNHIENANRVKLKKAMQVYDFVFNKMTVENGINGDSALDVFAPLNDCTNTSEYFKIAETLSDDNGTNCRFRTMDGVFWDISDIRKPIVALREGDLKKEVAESGTNRAFYLYAWFDENGSIRVDDLAAISEDDKESLQALYDFINGLTKTSMEEVATKTPSFIDNCSTEDDVHYNCSGTIYTKKTTTEDVTVDRYEEDNQLCIWNSDKQEQECPYTSTAAAGDYYFTEKVTSLTYCDETCQSDSNYYEAAKRYCASHGGELPTLAELKANGYDDGNFWASEKLDPGNPYKLGNGIVYPDDWGGTYYNDVVCVGK